MGALIYRHRFSQETYYVVNVHLWIAEITIINKSSNVTRNARQNSVQATRSMMCEKIYKVVM